MGNWLAVEMLRQAKIRGDMEFGHKPGEVMLASPDIDAQVFQSQAVVIGSRNLPIMVFVSRNDRESMPGVREERSAPRLAPRSPTRLYGRNDSLAPLALP